MDQTWTKQVAVAAAVDKVRVAEMLLRDAHDILVSNGKITESNSIGSALYAMRDIHHIS